MTKRDLVSVSIPKKILRDVDKIVEDSGKYISRADFCRAAVRELINKEENRAFTEGLEVPA